MKKPQDSFYHFFTARLTRPRLSQRSRVPPTVPNVGELPRKAFDLSLLRPTFRGKRTPDNSMPLFNLCFRCVEWEEALAPGQAVPEQPPLFIVIAQCIVKVKRSFYLNANQDKLGPRGWLEVMPHV